MMARQFFFRPARRRFCHGIMACVSMSLTIVGGTFVHTCCCVYRLHDNDRKEGGKKYWGYGFNLFPLGLRSVLDMREWTMSSSSIFVLFFALGLFLVASR